MTWTWNMVNLKNHKTPHNYNKMKKEIIPVCSNLLRTKYQCEEIGKDVIACFFRMAVVSMAGLAAEGLTYDKVVGESADLFTLQVWDLYFQNMWILNYSQVLLNQIIILKSIYFATEVYKQNKATTQQRSTVSSSNTELDTN
jgi:hypothetical protein